MTSRSARPRVAALGRGCTAARGLESFPKPIRPAAGGLDFETHRASASACPSKLRCTGVKRRAGRAQALETARANDLLFWASRYNLFVLWSADRTHPWDALPGAAAHTTLEIGKLRGSERDVRDPA